MTGRVLITVGLLAASAGLSATIIAAATPIGESSSAAVPPRPSGSPLGSRRTTQAPSRPSTDSIVGRNLFTTHRRPPVRRFGADAEGHDAAPPPAAFTLVGVLLGRPPAAVLQDGAGEVDRVVTLGEAVRGYRLVAVTDTEAVLVEGRDTLRLRLKEVR